MVPGGILLLYASLLVTAPSICQGACSINPHCSHCGNYTEGGHTRWIFYCSPYSGNFIHPAHFTVTNDTVDLFQVKYFSMYSAAVIHSGVFRNIPNIERVDITWDRSRTSPSISSSAFYYGVQKNLQTLLFRSSYLTAVPSTLRYLTALQDLDLGGNEITGDPSYYFSFLTSLRSLWLDNNRLYSSIPASLQTLANLRKLSVGSCYLNRSSVTSFSKLPTSLERLDIFNNPQLFEVPLGIGLLPNLTYLNMRYCNLNSLPINVFVNLNKLETLDLSQNPSIASYLDVLVNQKSLKVLRLSSIGSLFRDIPNAISGMEKLIELDLSNNGIGGVNHDQFAKLVLLRKLNLAQNNIVSVDLQSFQNCDQLMELDLRYNLIHEVSPIFFVPQSLGILRLNDNKFDTFDKCTVLKLLAHFQKTYISGDLFTCDCRLAWVPKLLAVFGSRVDFYGSCYLPRELSGWSLSSYPLYGCTPDDKSIESCNISLTTSPETNTESTTTSKSLNHSFVDTAYLSSINEDLRSVQSITTGSLSVAVVAIVAFVATLVVLLTYFFRQRNRVPTEGRSQSRSPAIGKGPGERPPEGQRSGENLYQNTAGMTSSDPSGVYEPMRKD